MTKPIHRMAPQGDVMLIKIAALPKGATPIVPIGGVHVIAHSETGHHHVVEDLSCFHFQDPKSALVSYLQLGDGCLELGGADLIHKRELDTHETRRLVGKPGDVFKVIRQREMSPAGWTRAAD